MASPMVSESCPVRASGSGAGRSRRARWLPRFAALRDNEMCLRVSRRPLLGLDRLFLRVAGFPDARRWWWKTRRQRRVLGAQADQFLGQGGSWAPHARLDRHPRSCMT